MNQSLTEELARGIIHLWSLTYSVSVTSVNFVDDGSLEILVDCSDVLPLYPISQLPSFLGCALKTKCSYSASASSLRVGVSMFTLGRVGQLLSARDLYFER